MTSQNPMCGLDPKQWMPVTGGLSCTLLPCILSMQVVAAIMLCV